MMQFLIARRYSFLDMIMAMLLGGMAARGETMELLVTACAWIVIIYCEFIARGEK